MTPKQKETANRPVSRANQETTTFVGTILLIDDDEISGQTLEMMLKTLGCHVIRVENGVDALQVINSSKLDLIITDLCIPHMSGIEIIQHVRQRSLNTPIFVITGFIETLLRDKSDELKISEILLKPIPLKVLSEKVIPYLRPAAKL